MRTLLVTSLLVLAALAALGPTASAQQSSYLALVIDAPLAPLTEDARTVTLTGVATLTVDVTAYTSTSGIPVTYALQAPPWMAALITPTTDSFPLPSTPPLGAAVTISRPFTITIVADALESDATQKILAEGWTTPSFLGTPAHGMGETIIVYDAPDPVDEEDECALTPEQKAALLAAGEDLRAQWEAEQEQAAGSGRDDVSVQNAGATLTPAPWVAVAAFGLVGAGVGLVLSRRSRK